MKRTTAAFALAGAVGLLAGGAVAAPAAGHFSGAKYLAQASVSLAHARTIALKSRPGTISDQELEKEGGGSGLRWSFDVKSGGKTYEVGVDAKTGKVLENDLDTGD